MNEFKLTKENNTILDNIRAGDWLLDYTVKRYRDQPNLRNLYNILSSNIINLVLFSLLKVFDINFIFKHYK